MKKTAVPTLQTLVTRSFIANLSPKCSEDRVYHDDEIPPGVFECIKTLKNQEAYVN